jgi:hypothetical protein
MIVKVIAADAKGAVARIMDLADYIVRPEREDGTEKCLHSRFENFLCSGLGARKAEMRALVEGRDDAGRRSDLVRHVVLSWDAMEVPELAQAALKAKEFLDATGYAGHQAVIGVHVDTDSMHVHMMVSRVDPVTRVCTPLKDGLLRAHAVMAGIEAAQGSDPNRNALFICDAAGQALPNPRRSRVSRRFAYASPEAVEVVLPRGCDAGRVEFPGMRRKGRCLYFRGQRQAAAVFAGNRLYFINWAYRDSMDMIRGIVRDHGATAIVQRDLGYVFGKDAPGIVLRDRPPAFLLPVATLPRRRSSWRFYLESKLVFARAGEPEIRIRSMACLRLRAHGFGRGEIEEVLARDKVEPALARHVSRWLFGPRGNMELFRQHAQGTLRMERGARYLDARAMDFEDYSAALDPVSRDQRPHEGMSEGNDGDARTSDGPGSLEARPQTDNKDKVGYPRGVRTAPAADHGEGPGRDGPPSGRIAPVRPDEGADAPDASGREKGVYPGRAGTRAPDAPGGVPESGPAPAKARPLSFVGRYRLALEGAGEPLVPIPDVEFWHGRAIMNEKAAPAPEKVREDAPKG